MSDKAKTGTIEERWQYLKNYRNDAKGISKPTIDLHECDVELHDHPSLTYAGFRFELAYVVSGRAIHLTEHTETPIAPGDYLLIDRGQKHGYRICEEPLTLLNSTFDYSDVDHSPSRLRTLTEVAKHYSILTDRDSALPIELLHLHDTDGEVKASIDRMIREHSEKRPGYQGIIKCRMLEIVLGCLRTYFCENLPRSYSPPVQRIIDYMTHGYMSSIPLSDFSSELGIPLRRLSKLFIKETGMPYTRYVLHKRISESCSLLTESDESIEFIAGYVGFSDSKAFRTRFKELTGISPREYRKVNKT